MLCPLISYGDKRGNILKQDDIQLIPSIKFDEIMKPGPVRTFNLPFLKLPRPV